MDLDVPLNSLTALVIYGLAVVGISGIISLLSNRPAPLLT